MEEKFFLEQIRRTNGAYDKGVVVKDTEDAARQSFHAYLGAYGYGKDPGTDYVQVRITDINGTQLDWKVDNRIPVPQPEPPETEAANE